MSECDIEDVRRYRSLFATGRRRILVDSEITPIRDILSFFHLFSSGVWQTTQQVRPANGVIFLPAFCWVQCNFTNHYQAPVACFRLEWVFYFYLGRNGEKRKTTEIKVKFLSAAKQIVQIVFRIFSHFWISCRGAHFPLSPGKWKNGILPTTWVEQRV